jgi:hypothetical protein
MYPRDFLDSYWRFGVRDSAFIAMPFHSEFSSIWHDALRPAIEQDLRPALVAKRVDASILSGSIIMEILDGIAHSRVVVADISIAQEGRWKGQRNGNVMYEVGIAHACRQSTEVLLLRSDSEDINFDLAGIRVHSYDRSDVAATRERFARLIADTLVQIDHTKGLQVQKAVDALDADALKFIKSWGGSPEFHGPEPGNMGEVLLSITKAAALSRLQTLGIVRCEPAHLSGKPALFWTEFGKAIVSRVG